MKKESCIFRVASHPNAGGGHINRSLAIAEYLSNYLKIKIHNRNFKMENVFKLEGMPCQGCADTIQGGLNEQSFIEKAKVSLEETTL